MSVPQGNSSDSTNVAISTATRSVIGNQILGVPFQLVPLHQQHIDTVGSEEDRLNKEECSHQEKHNCTLRRGPDQIARHEEKRQACQQTKCCTRRETEFPCSIAGNSWLILVLNHSAELTMCQIAATTRHLVV